MSLHDYRASKEISTADPPFYALIMAAMRQADTGNAALLHATWPHIWNELQARYNSPGGLLPGESGYDEFVQARLQTYAAVQDDAIAGQEKQA